MNGYGENCVLNNHEQIICFTHAGGHARFFNNLENDLPNIYFAKLEYPGHGKRGKEKLITDITQIVDDMYNGFLDCYSGGPYSLLGYSMGGIILAEVLMRIIKSESVNLPHDVFICACSPQNRTNVANLSQGEFDDWIKKRIEHYGEAPLKKNISDLFWKMYMPIYRADYTIIGNYHFDDLRLRSTIPLTVFYSENDTPINDIKRWEMYFLGLCDYYGFHGSHFFIKKYHKDIAEIINRKIASR